MFSSCRTTHPPHTPPPSRPEKQKVKIIKVPFVWSKSGPVLEDGVDFDLRVQSNWSPLILTHLQNSVALSSKSQFPWEKIQIKGQFLQNTK